VSTNKGHFADIEPPENLEHWSPQRSLQPTPPTDILRPTECVFKAACLALKLPSGLAAALDSDYGRFLQLLGGLQILLWRLSGNPDPAILIPAVNRSNTDIASSADSSTLLTIRTTIRPSTRVEDHVRSLDAVVRAAYEHHDTSDKVFGLTPGMHAKHERPFLSEVCFRWEHGGGGSSAEDRETRGGQDGLAGFDLSLRAIEIADELRLECDYNSALFSEATIRSWLNCYCTLLSAMSNDPSQSLGTLPLLDSNLFNYLLRDLNATATGPLPARNIPELLADAFAAMGTEPAAEFYGLTYSRARLDERSDRLASWLLRNGAGDGSLVGILMDRSLEMLVAVLAVLKAGAAYVPLDPKQPLIRLEQITSETTPPILLTLTRHMEELPKFVGRVLCVDGEATALATEPIVAFPAISRETRAYVIFTSGSTGRPKGVEVTHGAVVNLLVDLAQRLAMGPKDRLLAITTLAFDISVLELLLPLIAGGTVVIATQEDAADGASLMDLITATRTTVLQATPFTWGALLQAGFEPPPGFKMLCGGEAWQPAMGDALLAKDGRLWNMYGPTETTVWSSVTEVRRGERPLTIGPPIANTRFYVMDERRQPVPPGIPGELWIGGAGVAVGYFQFEELTEEKFLEDPYVPRERMFRTGDEVRQLPDGRIEFLGRLDQQIKLRGFRIELGEIEASMLGYPGVTAAIAVRGQDAEGGDILTGYYTAEDGILSGQLRDWLRDRLPAYMIPRKIAQLAAFPLTANGKIDRRALALMDAKKNQRHPAEMVEETERFSAADVESETELRMHRIWQKIFEGAEMSADSNFFDLGGDSLLLVRLQSMITRQFGVQVTMVDIAHHLTLRTLSAWVDQLQSEAASLPPARPLNPRVLPINSVEAATPIFMIPQMMIFSDMAAALGTSQPVYALQMLDEDVPSAMDSASLEEIAVLYCNLIREVQPHGPYRLGGWCLWGLVAYEVARLLEKQGTDVELLIIVDTWAPGHWDGHSPSRELFLAAAHSAYRLGRMARRFWLGTMEERKKDILSGLRSMRDSGPATPNNFAPSHIERLVSSAAVAYRPEPVQGNVLIFRSELRSGGPLARNDMGWGRVLRRPVNVTTLPGNHREIFDPPGANMMAECIQEMLDFEQAL